MLHKRALPNSVNRRAQGEIECVSFIKTSRFHGDGLNTCSCVSSPVVPKMYANIFVISSR